jgi:chromosome segregation ATPase
MINNKVTESESLKRQLITNENELRVQFENNLDAQTKSHAEKIAKIHE